MKYLIFFFVLITSLLFFPSCSGNEEEEARKKEREKMDEFLKGTKLQFYKAIKVSLRVSAKLGENPEIDKARATIMKIGGEAFSLGIKPKDSVVCLSPLELLAMAGELYKAKDILTKTDEDSLPTILGNIYFVMNKGESSEVPDILGYTYNNNTEHAVIGVLWFLSVKGPKEFTFYELDRTDESKISNFDLAMIMRLTKSLIYYENDFGYAGMDKANEFVVLCEKNKADIIASPPFAFSEGAVTPEQTWHQMHGMGCLLRGLNESKLEKEKEAMNDYETFLSDAEKGGLDNELTWIMGSYVSIKKEDKDKALMYLGKLEQSKILDQPELDAVKEIKGYINGRENGKALNKITDKVAMGKIAFHLLKKRAEKAKALQTLEQTEAGKKFFDLHKQLDEKAEYLDKIQGNISTDSLKNKAGDFVKGLFK
jgi:hypothetical protein